MVGFCIFFHCCELEVTLFTICDIRVTRSVWVLGLKSIHFGGHCSLCHLEEVKYCPLLSEHIAGNYKLQPGYRQ